MPIHCEARVRAPGRAAILAAAVILCGAASARAQVLTLDEALGRAAAADPAIAAYEARADAARAGVRAAGTALPGQIGAEVENLAGTGRLGLFDETETTFFYEQTLERGGKRTARVAAAERALDLTEARTRARVLDLLEQAQAAFVRAQAAAQKAAVAQARLESAERLEAYVARRVAGALDPLFTGERAMAGAAQARAALANARMEAETARATLASFWTGGAAFDLPPLEPASPAIVPGAVSPDEAVLTAERDAAAARVALARSETARDPTLRGGVRYLAGADAAALVVGASIPLGPTPAARGGVAQAEAEMRTAEAEIASARAARQREIATLTARQRSAAAEIATLEQDVIPAMQRAAGLAREGFDRGGGAFTWLEVNTAETALFDARMRHIALLEQFHLDGARLDRIAGRHLDLVFREEVQP